MIRKYLTQQQYDDLDGKLNSNVDYVIVENGSPINVTFVTNNITGLDEMYDFAPTPEGSYNITENGEYDVTAYASAYVNVSSGGGGDWEEYYRDAMNGTIAYIDSTTMPSGVTNLRPYMFQGCEGITYVDLPSTTYIGKGAFFDDINIITASLPSLNHIDYGNVFSKCERLTSVDIQSLPDTSSGTFQYCTALTTVNNTSALAYVGFNAFDGCTSLTTIDMSGITYIWGSAFNKCSSLTTVNLPSIVDIGAGNYSSNFYAFGSCTSLTTVDLGPNIKYIRDRAFNNCSALTSFTCRATTPPALSKNSFYGTPANLVIYVPAESVDAYKAATNWSTHADKIQAIA